MMINLSIIGTITSQFEELFEVINTVLPAEVVLKKKVRVLGEEINASSESLSLYVFRIDQNNYQFDSNFCQNIKGGLIFLNQLTSELQKKNISHVFDYYLSDNEGNCLTKEKSRRFSKVKNI